MHLLQAYLNTRMRRQVLLAAIVGILPVISLSSAFPNVPTEPIKVFNNSALNGSSAEVWDTWEAPEAIRKAFTYYRSGYDNDGLVVYVLEVGSANYNDLSGRSKEYIDEFWTFYEQLLLRVEFDAARNNKQGSVLLFDWDGFNLKNYASADALQIALKMFTSIVRINNAVQYGFDINVNFVARAFINLAKPFFGDMIEKFEFYGTRSDIWRPKLLRKIPADQLSPKYGGDENWKPLSLRVKIP